MNTNSSTKSINQWLNESTKLLNKAGIGTARLDCLVLLEDATSKDRSWLLAHPEFTVQGSTLYRLNRQVRRRAKHEPLAYIRGKNEFYGREFFVNAHTLEPRPETETMVTLALEVMGSRSEVKAPLFMVDIGTGSGAIAVTVKLERPDLEVCATDISENCLKIARQNAKKHQADVTFFKGDLLKPLLGSGERSSTLKSELSGPLAVSSRRISSDSNRKMGNAAKAIVLLCNLPYVPDSFQVNKAARHEPGQAIFGGQDGLDLYRKLFKQVEKMPDKPLYILTEALPPQHEILKSIAKKAGFIEKFSEDFIQIFSKTDTTGRLQQPEVNQADSYFSSLLV
jgi:release factor glutamine methyltransferase